jgi:YidC/Oxa1 family membrane protein insertase
VNNQRLLAWSLFGLVVWFTYQAWVDDVTSDVKIMSSPSSIEEPFSDMPSTNLPEFTVRENIKPEALIPNIVAPSSEENGSIISVVTDVFELKINTVGGTIEQAKLRDYPITKDQPDNLVEMLSTEKQNFGLIQTGLRATEKNDEATHLTKFFVGSTYYEMFDKTDLVLTIIWSNEKGIRVEKTYRFKAGSYNIEIEQRILNNSTSEWVGAAYAQILRRENKAGRGMFNVDSYSFDGPMIYDGEKSQKLDKDEILESSSYKYSSQNGWVTTIQHHFLNAIIPPPNLDQNYNVAYKEDTFTLSTIGNAELVQPGTEKTFKTFVYIGPKLQNQLEKIDSSLKLTVDYGWLTILSQPLFWVLNKSNKVLSNWGLSIIFVTILIKLLFYKLTNSAGRSMARMREVAPRMKAIQERYKDDKKALGKAMTELYKREKVNPAAGCLPLLIQMPFFLAFYWVLLESVEMRQAPFALWITDLSSRDPYFILPALNGAAMLFQQKLNPQPADPVQTKVMQIMPIMFTFMFAFFPSGLVLYWLTNTTLSISQQWHINKVIASEGQKNIPKNKNKKPR